MSTKHTPGPWLSAEYGNYGDYDGKCRVILGDGGDIRTAVVLGFDSEENQANALLIAAAPELLEALAELMRNFPTDFDMTEAGWDRSDIDKACSAHDKARAAYAKATGSAT